MKTNRKSCLDEMQNQKLLKLEEYGFWMMFWASLAVILGQLFLGGSFKEIAGEMLILLIGSAYLCVTSLKNGLWAKSSTPTKKGNALASILPAAVIGALNAARLVKNGAADVRSVLIVIAIMAGTYLACFAVLEWFRAVYHKRRTKLDGPEEESDENA